MKLLLPMSTRTLPLYRYPGAKPSSVRDLLLFNRVRFTAILLIVALSLTTIAFITSQDPPEYVPAPKMAASPSVVEVEDTPPIPVVEAPPSPPPPPPLPQTEFVGSSAYHPFLPPQPAAYIANQAVRPIRAHAAIPDECLDYWVSTGLWEEPCSASMVQDATIDLVWVWVNGSDPLHQRSRAALLGTQNSLDVDNFDGNDTAPTVTPLLKPKEARFREHDELRYSFRAALDATVSWPNSGWHIVSADVPHPNAHNIAPAHAPTHENDTNAPRAELNGRRRLGLVPQWLEPQCAANSGIKLHHDTQIFRLTGAPGTELTPADASDWLGRVIPSFNSHAVESQLAHLDPELVADNILALNDDQFLMKPLPPSAFHSTLYGPVFRMQPHLLVGGDASGDADGGGEWRSLGWGSHLMSQRFGLRKRPYLQHNARALSLPLMHELSLAFGPYFAATPLSQFRGSHNAPEELEVNSIFMATHFVIERHREALLWSWIVAKWGHAKAQGVRGDERRGMGVLDRERKRRMWRELGGRESDRLELKRATRTSVADVELNMWMAGLQGPTSPDRKVVGDTRYSWVSMDGYSASFDHLAPKTSISRSACLGDDEEPAWDMFLRLAQNNTQCGDDVIAALMHWAPNGLEVFLPPQSTPPLASPLEPLTLPLILPLSAPPLPANPRAFAVRLLQRYAYVIGDSPMDFIGLTSASTSGYKLRAAGDRKDLTMLCINDDMEEGEVERADQMLRGWFAKMWPEKLECER
ncbi:hypothetical protein C8R44DRAFT_760014 [Mycena epipterygia]|nr:hypothetical protein C8R44DRAFT_760014 [Mycena epipterygia]